MKRDEPDYEPMPDNSPEPEPSEAPEPMPLDVPEPESDLLG